VTRIFPDTPECVTALRQVRSHKGLRPDLLQSQRTCMQQVGPESLT
jgi:hypothetical protein